MKKEYYKSWIVCLLTAIIIGSLATIECAGQLPDLKFEHINTENGLAQNTITGIVKDKYGFMWFGTWDGLCRYDGYRFKVYHYQQENAKSIVNDRVLNITKDSNQNLWILLYIDKALCKYHYETDNFERIPVSQVSKSFLRSVSRNGHLSKVAVSDKNYKWDIEKAQKHLIQTNLSTNEIKRYTVNPTNRWSLNDPFVTDIYLDDEHILWVGTYGNGVNKANLDAKPFFHEEHDHWNDNSIIDNNVRTISEDKMGNIWVSTRDKGITVISPNHTCRHFQESRNGSEKITSNYIKTVFCDSRGYVWIGTSRGLDRYDPATNKIKHYKDPGLDTSNVLNAFEDHLHNILFATGNGIYKYIPANDTLFRQNAPGMPGSAAMAIIEDHLNQIWIGTEGGGIAIFRPAGPYNLHLAELLRHVDNNSNSISADYIHSLHQDISNVIWIGTASGLDRFNPQNHTFKHFTASPNGLSNSKLTGIVEDNSGSIWVSHNDGISQINRATLSIRNFSTKDGLQGNDFSDGVIFKSPSTGMLYLGGNNGFNYFYPDSIKTDHNLPKVVLTELQILNRAVGVNDTVNGRILLHKPIYMTQEISLNHRDKSIAIEFAGLHYANPSGNKYAYMLEGFDKDWIYTDANNRIATYSNLSRGHYTFKVKASNSDGIWNPVPATLYITVFPPWWQSTIAYVLYAIIFIGLLYAFYYYLLRYTRLKSQLNYELLLHEKDVEMQQSKIEFFTNISHEIKTPLSLILAPIERLMTEGKDNPQIAAQLQTMKNSGDRLLKLINQLLDIRRFETGNDKLRLQNDDLVSFVKQIVDAFAPLATEKSILLQFISAVTVFATHFDPDKMEKVLYNLISNSFKFTPQGGKITVSVRLSEGHPDYVFIDVTDNGPGIPKGELETIFYPFQQASTNKTGGTGLGLAYAKALVALHNGTIHAESANDNNGQNRTCFTVKLPAQQDKAAYLTTTGQPSDSIEKVATPAALDTVLKINGKAPTLLLVEDSFELRKYLSDYFAASYHILEAANGAIGLELANEHTPDLIISDMMMPEMDGLALCKALKSGLMTSHIPVILLTARTPVEYQIKGIETGADDYMTKPFNLQLLSVKVKNLLLIRMNLREKYKSGINIQPSGIFPDSPDDRLLKQVVEFVEKNIDAPELDVESISNEIGISKTQLYRKMKALTGLSMNEMIRDIRLKHAGHLLTGKKFNVNEIAYMVGFSDPDYFRKCFKAQFGVSPSEYAKNPPSSAL